jgi:carboxypeptidase Taq
MSPVSAYQALTVIHRRLYRLRHVEAMLSWDRSAMMPPKGNTARAEAEAELQVLIHQTRSEARIGPLLRAAEEEALDDFQRANLREMGRDWVEASALPEALVEAKSLAAARCEHAWRAQRAANDWAGFVPNLSEVVRLAREEAQHLGEAKGLAPYDALLDRYEPGMTAAGLDQVFGALTGWLPELISAVRARQQGETVLRPQGPFPLAGQRALSLALMRLLGFDFDGGRLDESTHPFTGGVAEDVRLTTRYSEDDFLHSLMSTIHETGHARYNQGLPRAWLGQPVGEARSYGIHESQSLSLEMQLARGRAFAGLLAPMLAEHLGAQPAYEAANLHRLLTRVEPGLIRVAADELTYPIHVILRYRIERALIGGEIEVADIPALWDEQMAALLGLDTRGNYRDGCMQDIHWAGGAFGYFPSYTLGALYAAQWFAAMRHGVPDLDQRIAGGDLAPVFDWLQAKVWSAASRYDTAELVTRASGGPLDVAHFRRYLEGRYLDGA